MRSRAGGSACRILAVLVSQPTKPPRLARPLCTLSQMSFSIETQQKRHVSVLTLTGRLTLGDATETLRGAVVKELDAGHNNILLEMSGVSYIHSAGLGALVGVRTTAVRRGANLKLAGLTSRIADLMRLTKLHTVFEIFANESGALLSFE